jgi:hypothetical protein
MFYSYLLNTLISLYKEINIYLVVLALDLYIYGKAKLLNHSPNIEVVLFSDIDKRSIYACFYSIYNLIL